MKELKKSMEEKTTEELENYEGTPLGDEELEQVAGASRLVAEKDDTRGIMKPQKGKKHFIRR